MLRLLHDRVVERVARTLSEFLRRQTSEIEIALRRRECLCTRLINIRRERAKLVQYDARAEHEHAAVPEVFLRVDVTLRRREIRLLDELSDWKRRTRAAAALDIAVTCLGLVWHDAERHQTAPSRRRRADRYGRLKRLHVLNDVIGRQYEQHGIDSLRLRRLILRHGCHRGDRNRGRSVTPARLENDRLRLRPRFQQLLGDQEAMTFVANDDRTRNVLDTRKPRQRLLQHRSLADERQQLLRIQLPRKRPQASAGAAGKNDRD